MDVRFKALSLTADVVVVEDDGATNELPTLPNTVKKAFVSPNMRTVVRCAAVHDIGFRWFERRHRSLAAAACSPLRTSSFTQAAYRGTIEADVDLVHERRTLPADTDLAIRHGLVVTAKRTAHHPSVHDRVLQTDLLHVIVPCPSRHPPPDRYVLVA
ncbi:hypothetical protein PHYPSEUDO_008442 [Phytophthora pseudosyringae]|uniref:Uncharacterized protein n=1 Tax=Phytophthora pseudosyringae TaxID=221518 RepID=A0A8T1VE56_9STRA|nr:hypothetical protein PHYPSEUDO_008442 [Phytophthora pseudosyringae]